MAQPGDIGEDTVTEAKAEAWVEMLKQGNEASHTYKKRRGIDHDRPECGSGHASSEGDLS